MSGITNTKVVNSQYNKGTYSFVVGALLTVVFVGLKDYGIDVSTELQGAVTTLVMAITALLVPNKEKI